MFTISNRTLNRYGNILTCYSKKQRVNYSRMFPSSHEPLLKHRIQKPKAPV
jgi:hypothetical protein